MSAQGADKLRNSIDFIGQMQIDEKVHVKTAQEMVEFINYCLGSSYWLTLSRAKQLRELNKEKAQSIRKNQDLFVETSHNLGDRGTPIEAQFSWLGLTKDG